MIVKFDHITYVGAKSDVLLKKNIANRANFTEIGLKNPEGKIQFMSKPQMDCDMYYVGTSELLPTEYVFYNELMGQTNISVSNRAIQSTWDYDNDFVNFFMEKILCLKKVAIEKEIHQLCYSLKGAFDKEEYYLLLKTGRTTQISLDWGGYQCPCLLVDSVEKIYNQCMQYKEIKCSFDTLVINNRELDISFIQIKGLEPIMEIISPTKK